MPAKITVLYFSRTTLMGGAESSLYDVVRKTNKKKYKTVCILPDDSGLLYKKLTEENIEIIIARMLFMRQTVNPFLLFLFFFALIYFSIKLIFILKKINPDIVVCNSFQDAFYAAIPAKLLNKKLIINIKNILDKKWKKKIRAKICSFFADRVIASSKKNAADYTDYSKKKDKIRVVYDGIDVEEFKKGYSKNDVYLNYLKENDKAIRIINIGNISQLKGQLLLVKAMESALLKKIDLKVFFAGEVNFKKDISYKEKILDFISQHSMQDKIFFLGYVNNLKDYIKYSDIVVHCPIQEEGLGMVILQGFCYKKIVIATDMGGIPEMIDDNETGFLCRPEPEDLAKKIIFSINNIENLENLKENAYIKLKKFFTLEEKIKKTENIYEELLEK